VRLGRGNPPGRLPGKSAKENQCIRTTNRHRCRDSAVKLVDDLAGESPVSADYPVGAVVISGDGTGDQTVGSLDVNALEGWT